jgi:hypothetical protein
MLIAFRKKGEDSVLWTTKFVQNILDYKMQASRWVTGVKAFMFLFYLATIFYTTCKTYVMYFFFLHLVEEIVEFFSHAKGLKYKEAA